MTIKMLQTVGVFESGKVYDVAAPLALGLVRSGQAKPSKPNQDIAGLGKNMKPGQVLKGGLSGN